MPYEPYQDEDPNILDQESAQAAQAVDSKLERLSDVGNGDDEIEYALKMLKGSAPPPETSGDSYFDALGVFGRTLKDLPTHIKASVAQGFYDPEDMTLDRSSWHEKAMDESNAAMEEARRYYDPVLGKNIVPGITAGDILDTGPSVGFSTASMGAYGVGALAGGAVGMPTVGGGAASLFATKEMATGQFNDMLGRALAESAKAEGRNYTQADLQQDVAYFQSEADKYGWYESALETIGNIVMGKTFGAGKEAFSGLLNKVFGEKVGGYLGKNIVTRTLSKLGINTAEELPSETATQIGQGGVEADVANQLRGIGLEMPGWRTEAPGVTQALGEVAAPVAAQTLFTGGLAAGTRGVYDLAKKGMEVSRRADDELATQAANEEAARTIPPKTSPVEMPQPEAAPVEPQGEGFTPVRGALDTMQIVSDPEENARYIAAMKTNLKIADEEDISDRAERLFAEGKSRAEVMTALKQELQAIEEKHGIKPASIINAVVRDRKIPGFESEGRKQWLADMAGYYKSQDAAKPKVEFDEDGVEVAQKDLNHPYGHLRGIPRPMSNYLGNKRSMIQAGAFIGAIADKIKQSNIVDVFAGSSLLSQLVGKQNPNAKRVVNDLNADVFNFHDVARNKPDELMSEVSNSLNKIRSVMSRFNEGGKLAHSEIADLWKEIKTRSEFGDPVQKAAAMALVSGQLGQFGKAKDTVDAESGVQGSQRIIKGEGASKPYAWTASTKSLDNYEETLRQFVADAKNTEVTNKDATEVLNNATADGLYLVDPPYVAGEGKEGVNDYKEGKELTSLEGALSFINGPLKAAHEKGAGLVYTNNFTPELATALRDLGFAVRKVKNLKSQNTGSEAGSRDEIVAYNSAAAGRDVDGQNADARRGDSATAGVRQPDAGGSENVPDGTGPEDVESKPASSDAGVPDAGTRPGDGGRGAAAAGIGEQHTLPGVETAEKQEESPESKPSLAEALEAASDKPARSQEAKNPTEGAPEGEKPATAPPVAPEREAAKNAAEQGEKTTISPAELADAIESGLGDASFVPFRANERRLADAIRNGKTEFNVSKNLSRVIADRLNAAVGKEENVFGGKVTKIEGGAGKRKYAVSRNHGSIVFNEATGAFTHEATAKEEAPDILYSTKGMRLRRDDRRETRQTVRDIVGNSASRTMVNEVLQNSIDALRERFGVDRSSSPKKGDIKIKVVKFFGGNYHFDDAKMNDDVERYDSSIIRFEIEDNGTGMTADDVREKFLKISGEGKDATLLSGGYGRAKLAFLFIPHHWRLETTKNGVTTYVSGNREQMYDGLELDHYSKKEGKERGTKLTLYCYGNGKYAENDPVDPNADLHVPGYNIDAMVKSYVNSLALNVPVEYHESNYYNNDEAAENNNLDAPVKYHEKPSMLQGSALDDRKLFMDPKRDIMINGSRVNIFYVERPEHEVKHAKKYNYAPKFAFSFYNKGIKLHELSFDMQAPDHPPFDIHVNVARTPDTEDAKYPFRDNRRRLQGDFSEKLTDIIRRDVQSFNERIIKMHRDRLKDMYDSSPEFEGVKVLIPYEKKDVESIKDDINRHRFLFEDIAKLFKAFETTIKDAVGEKVVDALKKVGGTQDSEFDNDFEFDISLDEKSHGFRLGKAVAGRPVYALNPFAITKQLMEGNGIYKALIDVEDAIERDAVMKSLMANNLVNTFIHEYAHNFVQSHYESFSSVEDLLHAQIGYGTIAELADQAYQLFDTHQEAIDEITSKKRTRQETDLKLMRNNSLVQSKELAGREDSGLSREGQGEGAAEDSRERRDGVDEGRGDRGSDEPQGPPEFKRDVKNQRDAINKKTAGIFKTKAIPRVKDFLSTVLNPQTVEERRFVKAGDQMATIYTDRSFGPLRRAIALPSAVARKFPDLFKPLMDIQAFREDTHQEYITDAFKNLEQMMNLKGQDADRLVNVIHDLDGNFDAYKEFGVKWFKEAGDGTMEANDEFYEKLPDFLRERYPKMSDASINSFVAIQQELTKTFITVHNNAHQVGGEATHASLKDYRNAMGKLPFYFPHKRYGSHYLKATNDKGETIYREHFDKRSLEVLGKGIDQFVKDRIKAIPSELLKQPQFADTDLSGAHWEVRKVKKLPEAVFDTPIPERAIQQVITHGLDKFDDETKERHREMLMQAFSDVFKQRGAGSSFIKRQNIPGYERTDVRRVVYDHVSGMYGYITKADAARRMTAHMWNIHGAEDPELYEYSERYVKDMLQNADVHDKLVSWWKSLGFVVYLGARVSTAAVNLTQNIITGIPALGMYVKYSEKSYFDALKDITTLVRYSLTGKAEGYRKESGLTRDEWTMIQKLYAQGDLQDQYFRSFQAEMQGKVSRAWHKAVTFMGIPMTVTERFNRASLALAAYRSAKKGHITDSAWTTKVGTGASFNEDQAIEFCKMIVNKAHFIYRKGNVPQAMRGTTGGKYLSTAYQFRRFTHNMLSLWTEMLQSGPRGRIALMKSLAGLMSVGGLASMPLYATFMNAAFAATGDDWEEKLRKMMPKDADAMRDMLIYGLPSLAGVNLSGSMAIDLPYVSDTMPKGAGETSALEILGIPYAFLVEQPQKFNRSMEAGEYYRAFTEDFPFMPMAARQVFSAIRLGTEGSYTRSGREVRAPGERGPMKLGFMAALGKSLGFQPTSMSNAFKASVSVQKSKEFLDGFKRNLADEYTNAQRRGDKEAMLDIRRQVREWNKEARSEKKPYYVIDLSDSLRARRRPVGGAGKKFRSREKEAQDAYM